MITKYLKATKKNGRSYWWLVEAHREGGKVMQKKLKYWGIQKPGEIYYKFLILLDDDRPLDDLWLVWQTDNKTWRSQKWPGFTYCIKHGQEQWYWGLFYRAVQNLDESGVKTFWLTRAPNRSEAIKSAKGHPYIAPESAEALERMTGVRHYPALVFDLSSLPSDYKKEDNSNGKR